MTKPDLFSLFTDYLSYTGIPSYEEWQFYHQNQHKTPSDPMEKGFYYLRLYSFFFFFFMFTQTLWTIVNRKGSLSDGWKKGGEKSRNIHWIQLTEWIKFLSRALSICLFIFRFFFFLQMNRKQIEANKIKNRRIFFPKTVICAADEIGCTDSTENN